MPDKKYNYEQITSSTIRTTHAKTSAVAKVALRKPSWIPTATASAVTVAEWDDGIPPEAINCLASQRLSLYLYQINGRVSVRKTLKKHAYNIRQLLSSHIYTKVMRSRYQ
jgi:hypothetical protein